MPLLEVYDTVVLKDDESLLGTVERTSSLSDGFQNTSLDDLLIVNYADVPESILIDFIHSGIPPSGYAFVLCVDEEKGAYLASQNDLELRSRSFDLGDVVKRNGQQSTMLGTVVNFSDTYDLEPVFYETPDGRVRSYSVPQSAPHPTCHASTCAGLAHSHDVIANVPAEEIVNAQSVFEGDLVMVDDWVGAIDDSDFDIVLLRADRQVLVLKNPGDLHIPIKDPEKPLVSLPEFDQLARPAVLSAFQGWSTIPALKTPRLGTFVTTSKDTLTRARWIGGQRAVVGPNEGIVIGVIPRTIDVRWITPNPFTRKAIHNITPPSHRQTLYSNINEFDSQKDLKMKTKLKICDGTSYPSTRSQTSTNFDGDRTQINGSANPRPAGAYQDLRTGDQVRFRDPFGAAVKYAGSGEHGHGVFRRIPVEASLGWDINCLKIISKAQQVTVQWQDGTETSHAARDLYRFAAFESALTPGNIVVGRAGLKQRPSEEQDSDLPRFLGGALSDFNEMAFFERRHDLLPRKVGVIQSVDHQERVAQVRWFQDPNVVLLEAGEMVHVLSKFGPIGDVVEEVSLFEVMTFPAFDGRLRDFVVLPPNTSFERLQSLIRGKSVGNAQQMPLAVNPTLDFDRLITRARACLSWPEITKPTLCSPDDSGDGAWVGEIVAIGLDGTLSARMRGVKTCRDVRIPLDVVLAIINVDDLGVDELDANEEIEEWWEDYLEMPEDRSRSPSTISETIEYEGGTRMDEDEDDEAWVSAEEEVEEDAPTDDVQTMVDEDVDMIDVGTQTQAERPTESATFPTSLSRLLSSMPAEPPLPFDVLSIPPPPDQYSQELEPNTSPAFLKRIRKEHKTLSSSLPEGQIYVRTYESRLDLLRCLIIGPPDTPYEDAPFLIDLYLGRNFPDEPPIAHFHSWTSGLGRINPNLYEEGKICLSLLGTWPGKESQEGWSKDATILQVLVSLQGLVMVRNPFFNEAGFEGYEEGGSYRLEAAQYAEKAFVMARGFVKHALERPPVGLEDVLAWLYLPSKQEVSGDVTRRQLLKRILERGQRLIEKTNTARTQSEGDKDGAVQLMDAAGQTGDPTKAFLRPLSRGAVVMLKRMLTELESAAI